MLDIPYEHRALGTALGAQWYQGIGWAFVGTSLPAPLRHYRPKAHSWSQWMEDEYLGVHSATDPAPAPDATTGDLVLRRDQLVDVRLLMEARNAGAPEFLIGSEVGTGKTLVAVSAVKRMSNVRNVLVVCPLSVAPGWRIHLKEMGDGGKRWCIINYESAKKLLEPPKEALTAKKTRTKNLHTANKGTSKVQWDVVITDEAHHCFPAGTMIRTDIGEVDIATLVNWPAEQRPRALSRGGDGTLRYREITDTMASVPSSMVKVIHEQGEFVCTPDHPIFTTERGYVSAQSLRGMQGVHGGKEDGRPDVLEVLPKHQEEGATSDIRLSGVSGNLRNEGDESHLLLQGVREEGDQREGSTSEGVLHRAPRVQELQRQVQGANDIREQDMLANLPFPTHASRDTALEASRGIDLPELSDGLRAEGTLETERLLLEEMRSATSGAVRVTRAEGSPTKATGVCSAVPSLQGGNHTTECLAGGPRGVISAHEEVQPHEQPRERGEDAQIALRTDLPVPRGEQPDHDAAAGGGQPHWTANGVHHRATQELVAVPGGGESPMEVFGGPGRPQDKVGHRDRREVSPDQEVEVSGPQEGAHPVASRVVRVEVLELGGRPGPGSGSQGDPLVYNLSVREDENYFADGVHVHNCGNPESQQSRTLERLIKGPGTRSAFVIRMSATAGSNPAQLSYLHRGLFWSDGKRPRPLITADEYREWCESKGITVTTGRFGNSLKWEGEESELRRMSELIYGGPVKWATRRRPEWPEQQRVPVPVDLTPEEMDAYEADWAEFQGTLKDIERAKKARASKRMSAAARARADATDRAKGLAAQTRYRQKAGQVRASGTAEFVAEMVSKGKQVAVSCEYIGTVEKLVERLTELKVPVTTFTGQNPNEREENRIAYQRGEYKVIIFTPTEGFNLHAGDTAVGGNSVPRVTVVGEPRWSPKKALQAEGRGQRNGTEAPVYYCFATETVEETVIKRVIEGMKNTSMINGEDSAPFKGLAEALHVPYVMAA